MHHYKVKVVISKNELAELDIQNKITDFQSVFSEVASRYYSDKFRESHRGINDFEAE